MQDDKTLKTHFDRDGFVAIPGFLSEAETAELNANINRYIQDVVPTMPRSEVFYEDVKQHNTLKQIQRMFAYDPFFEKLMFKSRFEKVAQALLAEEAVGKNLQFFNKPPGVGQPTPPHQDGFYFMLEPCQAVTMWLALEPVDEENGCVRYVRGSHERGMRSHGRTQTLGFSQGIVDFGTEEDQADAVAMPAQPGDLLVHHALAIHWAEGNRSVDRTRKALGLIYYGASAREDEARHKQYQEELAQSMAAAGKV